ncbi:MAG: hypothetical protein KGR46_10075 [Verrucomicrobia bacterium]|nr:hypothetical protein [Verrucomicrobiota bacterium]
MHRIAILLVLIAVQTASSFAAQLDIAIIRFPEPKTVEQLNADLAGQSLAEITNADRTVTSVAGLKGGTVLYSASLPAGAPATSTRLGNSRADTEFALKNGSLAVQVTLSEGVAAGLRKFSSRTYQGTAPLPAGSPRVISLRTIASKTKSVTKDKSEVRDTTTTHALIAQLR